MTSNLDKLAAVVSPSARNTKAVSLSVPLVILEEVDGLSESLGLPRSAVFQALIRDGLIARGTSAFREFVAKYEPDLEEHFDAVLPEDDLRIFDPDRYEWSQMTLEEAVNAAKAEIEAVEKRWSL